MIAICKSQLHSNEVSLLDPIIYFVIATNSPSIHHIPIALPIAICDCHAITVELYNFLFGKLFLSKLVWICLLYSVLRSLSETNPDSEKVRPNFDKVEISEGVPEHKTK